MSNKDTRILVNLYCENCFDNRTQENEDEENDLTPFEMTGAPESYKNQWGQQSRRYKCPICKHEVLVVLNMNLLKLVL